MYHVPCTLPSAYSFPLVFLVSPVFYHYSDLVAVFRGRNQFKFNGKRLFVGANTPDDSSETGAARLKRKESWSKATGREKHNSVCPELFYKFYGIEKVE